MTLEPDPAAVLVHERLEQAVSSMRAPDVEAGWAALAAQLEAPIAPVVPLHKPSRGRFVALAVAAALMVAGSAFAAVRYAGGSTTDPVAPAVSPVHASVTGPHAHAPFSGPHAEDRSQPHHEHGGTGQGGPGDAGTGHGGTPGTGDGGGTPSPGTGGSGEGTSKPGDDPNDRDQGTGNDGQHNDHGGGNNGAEGTHPSTSGGSSHGGSNH